MMDKKALYLQVYNLLEHVTPLKKDCGDLCNKACCRGTGNDSGMYLFPGEEDVQFSSNFMTVRQIASTEPPLLLAVCNGECDRDKRPLACRIFPLTPYITLKDILTIKMDPRGYFICPLARTLERADLNLDFVKRVRQGCRLLMTDPEIKEFTVKQSRLLDELTHDLI